MSWKKEKIKTPIILESEDWTKSEWKAICKLFDTNIKTCEIIRIDKATINVFNKLI